MCVYKCWFKQRIDVKVYDYVSVVFYCFLEGRLKYIIDKKYSMCLNVYIL